MNKQTIIALALTLCAGAAKAQTANGSSIQSIKCQLTDVVGVGMGGGTGTGGGGSTNTVDLPMGGTSGLATGIESPEFTINLFSNAAFDVSVQAAATDFTYTGPSTSGTTMHVKDVLSVVISDNKTGGTVANGYSAYQTVDGTTGKKVIGDGQVGVRSFGFKYKANPGFNYPAGTYSTSIVYTITKH